MVFTQIKIGDIMWYKKPNIRAEKCKIQNIHMDDCPNIYYTIILSNGQEIQTISNYLSIVIN
jgi:hypothetical protein